MYLTAYLVVNMDPEKWGTCCRFYVFVYKLTVLCPYLLLQPSLPKLCSSRLPRTMFFQGRQLSSQSKLVEHNLWAISGSRNCLEGTVTSMGGRISLGKVAHFKWGRPRHAMQATIDVWSPTLLEVKLHSVPASLLVRMCCSCEYILKLMYRRCSNYVSLKK